MDKKITKKTKLSKKAKYSKKKNNKKIAKSKSSKTKKRSAAVPPSRPRLLPLYRWYAKTKRDLPFRGTKDFYPIWVSEIMLQQTRVAAMLPRYREFMERFPTIADLAAATEEEVLAAWRGLGYYSRARNLRLGARQIMAEFDGRFPAGEQAARGIAGVGEYTAAAILSIAFGKPLAVFDGNVRRVLSRLFYSENDFDEKVIKARAREMIEHRGSAAPGDHNQALMELGAVVCLPGVPDCPACPLADQCAGLAAVGGPGSRADLAAIPPSRKDGRVVEIELRVFYVHERGPDLVWIVRDERSRFFKNLWFFPVQHTLLGGPAEGAEFPDSPGLETILAGGRAVRRRFAPGTFAHSITHHTIRGVVEVVELEDRRGALWKKLTRLKGVSWKKIAAADLDRTVVSSITRKILPFMRSDQPWLL